MAMFSSLMLKNCLRSSVSLYPSAFSGKLNVLPSSQLVNPSPGVCQARLCVSGGMDAKVQKIAKSEKVEFWEKNKNLNRPVSPHMTIYSWQYTNSLSITHRATGIMMYGGLLALAVPYIALPYMFPAYIQYLTSFAAGKVFLGAVKLSISLPVTYHALNGIRHLFWDAGYGLTLEQLKASGYLIVGTSVILSLILAVVKF